MSKSIKFFSVILIIFSMFISFYGVVHASNINMNLVANETATNEDENAIVDNNPIDASESQTSTSADEIIPPSSVSATVEEGLGLANILSILLITVGVILILLSIAIIIRLK